jgi:hypothetical protein
LDEVCFLNIFHGEVTYLPSSPVQVHWSLICTNMSQLISPFFLIAKTCNLRYALPGLLFSFIYNMHTFLNDGQYYKILEQAKTSISWQDMINNLLYYMPFVLFEQIKGKFPIRL